jgi:hypothetical protein
MNNEITLEGLTKAQCVIADCLWKADTQEDIAKVIALFGETEVNLIKQLMLAAMFDEVEDVSHANALLKSFTL